MAVVFFTEILVIRFKYLKQCYDFFKLDSCFIIARTSFIALKQ